MGKFFNFITVFLILVLIALGNIYVYFRNARINISGFSIAEVGKKYQNLDVSTIIFIVQWVIIAVIVFIFYIKFLKKRKEEKQNSVIKVEREGGKGKTSTALDELYELLKEKKNLKIPIIAKTFKIDKEKALDWCRILEEHNLVNIDYPPFSEPEVTIK